MSKAIPAKKNAADTPPAQGMTRLVLELIRPYRGWLIVVFIAMLFETAMSIAAPWPLKIIIDNVVGKHPLPEFLTWLRDFSTFNLAGVVALGAVVIALIGAVAATRVIGPVFVHGIASRTLAGLAATAERAQAHTTPDSK